MWGLIVNRSRDMTRQVGPRRWWQRPLSRQDCLPAAGMLPQPLVLMCSKAFWHLVNSAFHTWNLCFAVLYAPGYRSRVTSSGWPMACS